MSDMKGCCVSKDGTLVITAAERAFVPVAYMQDEIIPCPTLRAELEYAGHMRRKNSNAHGHTPPERILEKAGALKRHRPAELVPYSADSSRDLG